MLSYLLKMNTLYSKHRRSDFKIFLDKNNSFKTLKGQWNKLLSKSFVININAANVFLHNNQSVIKGGET